jgi:hypothetical protein
MGTGTLKLAGLVDRGKTMKKKMIVGAAILGLLMAAGCLPPGGGGSTEQEILVQQGAATVSSGSGEYFFGEGVIIDGEGGKTSSAIAFTVLNQGGKDLSISGVSLSSGDTGDFDLDASALAGTIGSHSSSSFTLRFDPLVSMTMKSSVATIQNNDADEGVYTFVIKGIGMKKLVAADRASSNSFGGSVAFSVDTAVVGAVGANAAYIFYRNPPGGESLQEVKKLTGSGRFGYSVALSGDVVVVGAPDADTQEGATFVY